MTAADTREHVAFIRPIRILYKHVLVSRAERAPAEPPVCRVMPCEVHAAIARSHGVQPDPRGHPLSRDAPRAACRPDALDIRSRPVGPRGSASGSGGDLRAPRAYRRRTRSRPDREHERGVFTVVQAAVRSSSSGRVDAGPELSTFRSSRQSRWRRAAPLPARISRSLERRSRRARSRVDGPHARRARRRAEQSHRIVL